MLIRDDAQQKNAMRVSIENSENMDLRFDSGTYSYSLERRQSCKIIEDVCKRSITL